MLDKKIVDKLNAQINMEWHSAYIYLNMSNYYSDVNLDGFANWFRIQAQEERDHALLFMDYLLLNSEKVVLGEVKAADAVYTDFRQALAAAYEHECRVSASINDIYGSAYEAKDFRTMQFLDWFVKEQIEEEKNTDDILKRYDLFGTDAKGLYSLDAELKTRAYTAPSLVL